MINQERAEKAYEFLHDTSVKVAELHWDMEASKRKHKAMYHSVYLHEKGTVDERKAKAETHEDVDNAYEDYLQCGRKWEELKNKREAADLLIQIWRSINASERQG